MLRILPISSNLFVLAIIALSQFSDSCEAEIVDYEIRIDVTAAPNTPGTFIPWDTILVPEIFVGTFQADDTTAGPISNLSLVVGGINIGDTFTVANLNTFDPTTDTLRWTQFDPLGQSIVSLGSFVAGIPNNYAVGLELGGAGPVDPFFAQTQNWVGTVSISESLSSVPEPSCLCVLFAVLGSAMRRRRPIAEIV